MLTVPAACLSPFTRIVLHLSSPTARPASYLPCWAPTNNLTTCPTRLTPSHPIHAQGSVGHTFFVLTDGLARVTLNVPNQAKEKELQTLASGSFFGEICLLDPSSKRTANIISDGPEGSTCLTLSRADFNHLIKEEKRAQAAADDGLPQRKVQSTSTSQLHASRKEGIRPHRKITGMSLATKDDAKMATIIGRAAKFFVEGLWISLYSRLYRDVVILDDSLSQAGEVAWAVLEAVSSLETSLQQRDRAVAMFRTETERILTLAPAQRSTGDHNFIYTLLRQRNKIRDILTSDWHPYQFKELCKQARFSRHSPLDHILDVGNPLSAVYVILRGCVRVWSGHDRMDLRHLDDLCPGEIFGEMSVLSGSRSSKVFAQALTEVDVVYFDADAYRSGGASGWGWGLVELCLCSLCSLCSLSLCSLSLSSLLS